MKTKVVWKKDIDCDGVIYHTAITKPLEYGEKWQVALHVKVNGVRLHDYSTHFIDGSGVDDGQVILEQAACLYGRLIGKFPKLKENTTIWYRKMYLEYFIFDDFNFEV